MPRICCKQENVKRFSFYFFIFFFDVIYDDKVGSCERLRPLDDDDDIKRRMKDRLKG